MRSHTDNISSSLPLHFRRRIVHFDGGLSTVFPCFPMYLIILTFTFLKLIYHHSDEGSSLSIFIIAIVIVIFLWFLTDCVLAAWPDVTFFFKKSQKKSKNIGSTCISTKNLGQRALQLFKWFPNDRGGAECSLGTRLQPQV